MGTVKCTAFCVSGCNHVLFWHRVFPVLNRKSFSSSKKQASRASAPQPPFSPYLASSAIYLHQRNKIMLDLCTYQHLSYSYKHPN
jgi:hypothetical protein